MTISLIDIYEFVTALAGTVFSVTLIVHIHLHGKGNFRETRRKRASGAYKARVAERRRLRRELAIEDFKASKEELDRKLCSRKPRRDAHPIKPMKMVRVLSSFSREMAREPSNSGQWRVREIEITEQMLAVSQPLPENPAICSGW
ncbi:hypothetical protein AAF712_004538 [Marasmius tenuissimus]|uniref:Uncharacterized protein n=1 Tax=Marasmius tenuissimus TaxID=585030 RepID=A0ABR3A3A7_9AGAR